MTSSPQSVCTSCSPRKILVGWSTTALGKVSACVLEMTINAAARLCRDISSLNAALQRRQAAPWNWSQSFRRKLATLRTLSPEPCLTPFIPGVHVVQGIHTVPVILHGKEPIINVQTKSLKKRSLENSDAHIQGIEISFPTNAASLFLIDNDDSPWFV